MWCWIIPLFTTLLDKESFPEAGCSPHIASLTLVG